MTPNIGLSQKNLDAVIKVLATDLADLHVIYIKTRNYHWNVQGPNFHALHLFLESQYDLLEESIDEVAERIRALGGQAPGSMKQFLALSTLSEDSKESVSAPNMLAALLADHETVATSLRNQMKEVGDTFGDDGTADFLTGLLEQHEKMAWMLRAHLA